MNRTSALLLAMALLLAHALAIHMTEDGVLAKPYERAHVAYRAGRSLAHGGSLAWNPGSEVTECYPSPLWVGVCALAERAYIAPTRFSQMIGLLSALATVAVVAGFSRQRMAGVIAPLLLVTCGTLAAAALSGTEHALAALFASASFLAFERRHVKALGVLLALLILTRPEGLVFALALLVLERAPRLGTGDPRPGVLRAFALPLVVAILALTFRRTMFGTLTSPTGSALALIGPETVWLGLAQGAETALLLGAPLLVLVPLALLVQRRLGGLGTRALLLACVWASAVIVQGGDDLPFGAAFLPAIPLLYIAVQEALTRLMDTGRVAMGALAWGLFVAGLAASLLGSKFPSDLGPFRVGDDLRARLTPGTRTGEAWGRSLGRLGLEREKAEAGLLRRLGIFIRDRMEPGITVLSPWPGSIAYISQRHVTDMLVRATPGTEIQRGNAWGGRPKVDLLELLQQEPDYIVPTLNTGPRPPLVREIALEWLNQYDAFAGAPGRQVALAAHLAPYELIAVPVPLSEDLDEPRSEPFHLLRNRDLGLGPKLTLYIGEGEFRVHVTHRGHQQLAELEVELEDSAGTRYWLRPTGTFVRDVPTHARTRLLLYPGSEREIELVRARLPEDVDGVRLSALLRNPGSQDDLEFSLVSEAALIEL